MRRRKSSDVTNALILNERAPELGHGIEASVGASPPEPRLDAAGGAANREAVAGDAGSLVEDWSEAFIDFLLSFEFFFAGREAGQLVGGEVGERITERGDRRRRSKSGEDGVRPQGAGDSSVGRLARSEQGYKEGDRVARVPV